MRTINIRFTTPLLFTNFFQLGKRIFLPLPLFIFLGFSSLSHAQMIEGSDTLYGNEWLNLQQSYHKIQISNDGIYRLSFSTLNSAGVFSGATPPNGSDFQLFKNGQQVPIYVTTSGAFGASDYIEFFATKNRGEIDKYLYDDPNYQINPLYSLYTDTADYFLTWNTGIHDRFINTPNNLINPPPKEDYCLKQNIIDYHDEHFIGRSYASSSDISSKYDLGEGYLSSDDANNQSFNLLTPNFYSTGINTAIKTRLLTKEGNHNIQIDFNNTNYSNDTYFSWAVKEYTLDIPSSTLSSNNTLKIAATGGASDKIQVATIDITYPRTFNFSNNDYFKFTVIGNNQSQYLEITNFDHGSNPPVLYDLTNHLRIVTQLSGNTVKVVLPPSATNRELVLISNTAANTITSLPIYNFIDYGSSPKNYIILTHKSLLDDGNGNNYIQDYANYRASVQGGGYNTIIVDIDQVYHQFGYGIERHEQSIRNFTNWAVKNWNSEYLFIIGKGVWYNIIRNYNPDWSPLDFVPSFGYPSSDNLFAATNNSNIPNLAVGRIAAFTPDMVRQYLEKVQDMENITQTAPQTIADKAWMKNILHLGGGDENIQNFIRNRLQEIGDTITQGTYGANVFSLYKFSTDIIQSATTNDVVNFINNGVGLITFFGHSAPNTLDFDIGAPTVYQNNGKYPIIYAMGCNTNRLFEVKNTLSEQYVFVEDKGAVGFIGSTATTSLTNLSIYGDILYQNIANKLYGETIGKIMVQVVEEYPLGGFWGELVQNNIMLHGDPALRLYPQEGSDFLINKNKSRIVPNFVNVQSDNFNLELNITNLGKTVNDSLAILVEQEYPTGERIVVNALKIPAPSFEAKVTITIPLDNKEIIGENKLHITLDNENDIIELPAAAEFNNTATIPFQVISNNAFPVYPSEYAIVNSDILTLKASTANAFSQSVDYHIEIDTSANFNSPLRQEITKPSSGGLINWTPTVVWQDSTVYYWRISIDSTFTNGNGFDWRQSSFIYINGGGTGWSQSTHIQKSKYSEATLDVSPSYKEFAFLQKELKITNASFPTFNFSETALFIDGFKVFNFALCPGSQNTQTLWAAVFDSNTLERVVNTTNTNNCFGGAKTLVAELNSLSERQRIIDFLNNEADPGDYVGLFITKHQNASLQANTWAADSIAIGTNLFQVLEAQGATQIRDLVNNEQVYNFIYKKDDPTWSGLIESRAFLDSDILQSSTPITGRKQAGDLTSLPIGPSSSWQSLHWNVTDKEAHDLANIDLIGIDQNGNDSLLIAGISATDTAISSIDAAIFPYLKLRLNLTDTVNRTAPQLEYWRVIYNEIPEFVLYPEAHLVFNADTLQQGEPLVFEVAAENISTQNSDSLLVRYTLTNEFSQETVFLKKYKPLNAGDTLHTYFSTDTRIYENSNVLKVEINPNNDQPEQFAFNNVGVKEFFVKKDLSHPVLDVTFDGTHIFNGDIISAKPEIIILLKDENQFLALADTSLFRLFVTYPSGAVKQFYFDGQSMIFYPADEDNLDNKNEAKIEWRPHFIEDGKYQLQIQARDASDNESGKIDYTVDFEVYNESRITNVLNYPNPFTSSTQFVFTLTGDKLPDDIKIQIMTVSGVVVKEVRMEEMGPLKIGLNRTEYRWDGTDQFGDRLANGVYIYHVIATKDGEELELRNNGTFDYFKSNLGKMVLLR